MRFYLVLGILILVSFVLQLLWVQYLPIFGIGPQILLVVIIYFALNYGPIIGEIYGFISGLFLDIFSISVFGTQCFIFTIIGYINGIMSNRVDEKNIRVQCILSLLETYFQIGIVYLFSKIFLSDSIISYKDIIIAPIYTSVLAPGIFRIMDLIILRIKKWFGKTNQI